MAFTELNFVPGEIVTAAKMNLLAANDVWLKENGGGMKFIKNGELQKTGIMLDSSYQDVAKIDIPEEYRESRLFIILSFTVTQNSNDSISRINFYVYANENSLLNLQEFRTGLENDVRKKTNDTGTMYAVKNDTNRAEYIKIKTSLSNYSNSGSNARIRYQYSIFKI